MPAKVSVRDLRKQYGSVTAIDGVSFDIEDGEIFGLIGPNGAGKTTTVECVIGLREPDGGRIEVCGLDARRRPMAVKQKIGAALQSTALQDKITPREALTLFGAFYDSAAKPEVLLDRFGIGQKADSPFDTLSGGQRQRLALALAFLNNPEVVLLDEPTAGLDAQSRRDLRAEIARMRSSGRALLLTTHDIAEAEALCDRIAIIDRGRLIAIGTPRELTSRSQAATFVSVTTTKPVDPAWLATAPGVHDLTVDGASARLRADDPVATVARLLSGLQAEQAGIVELHVEKAALEDVLIELTRPTSLEPGTADPSSPRTLAPSSPGSQRPRT
jgi:ABC-2 type transport system ATP-binding protein